MNETISPPIAPKNIRFLTVVPKLTRGGLERVAVNYATGYKRIGHPSALLAYESGGLLEQSLREAGIDTFIGAGNEATLSAALESAKRWEPDIIHIHRPGLPNRRSAEVLRALVNPRRRVFETNVFGYVDDSPDRELIDIHLLLSRWCLWKWRQSSRDITPRPIGIVVPYAVDSTRFKPATECQREQWRKQLGIPTNAFVFGRVGQPSFQKWSRLLIQAFSKIATQVPNAWLLMVGPPEEICEQSRRLPANQRRRIIMSAPLDSDDELQKWYAAIDAFIHTSQKGESFGMVLCEAMLCGLPVITMSTPLRDNSQIEVVRAGTTGRIVSTKRELEAAMVNCTIDGSLSLAAKRNGPAHVIAQYDTERVVQTLVSIARTALAAKNNEQLASTLADNTNLISEAAPKVYLELLEAAGLPYSPRTHILPQFVNLPISRRLIRGARAAYQISKEFREGLAAPRRSIGPTTPDTQATTQPLPEQKTIPSPPNEQ